MEVKLIKENEDGSADYEIIGLSQVEQEFLIQKGLIATLRGKSLSGKLLKASCLHC
jgi:hypothetical protein